MCRRVRSGGLGVWRGLRRVKRGLCGWGVRALGGTIDGLQMGDVHDKDEE